MCWPPRIGASAAALGTPGNGSSIYTSNPGGANRHARSRCLFPEARQLPRRSPFTQEIDGPAILAFSAEPGLADDAQPVAGGSVAAIGGRAEAQVVSDLAQPVGRRRDGEELSLAGEPDEVASHDVVRVSRFACVIREQLRAARMGCKPFLYGGSGAVQPHYGGIRTALGLRDEIPEQAPLAVVVEEHAGVGAQLVRHARIQPRARRRFPAYMAQMSVGCGLQTNVLDGIGGADSGADLECVRELLSARELQPQVIPVYLDAGREQCLGRARRLGGCAVAERTIQRFAHRRAPVARLQPWRRVAKRCGG